MSLPSAPPYENQLCIEVEPESNVAPTSKDEYTFCCGAVHCTTAAWIIASIDCALTIFTSRHELEVLIPAVIVFAVFAVGMVLQNRCLLIPKIALTFLALIVMLVVDVGYLLYIVLRMGQDTRELERRLGLEKDALKLSLFAATLFMALLVLGTWIQYKICQLFVRTWRYFKYVEEHTHY